MDPIPIRNVEQLMGLAGQMNLSVSGLLESGVVLLPSDAMQGRQRADSKVLSAEILALIGETSDSERPLSAVEESRWNEDAETDP